MIERISSIARPTLRIAVMNFESSTCCCEVWQGGWADR
jgi:hypothetical protein